MVAEEWGQVSWLVVGGLGLRQQQALQGSGRGAAKERPPASLAAAPLQWPLRGPKRLLGAPREAKQRYQQQAQWKRMMWQWRQQRPEE